MQQRIFNQKINYVWHFRMYFFHFLVRRLQILFVFFGVYGSGLRSKDYFVFNEGTNTGIWRVQSANIESIVFRRIGRQGCIGGGSLQLNYHNSSLSTATGLKYDRTSALLVIIVIEYFCKTLSNTIFDYGLDDRGIWVENRAIILHHFYCVIRCV